MNVLLIILRRIPVLVLVLFVVSVLTFLLTSLLEGDPAILLAGDNATEENIAAIREDLRLDDPIHERYVSWLGDAAQGDLGRSYRTNQEVSEAISNRFPVTFQIGLMATVMAVLIAIPLGTFSAYRAGKTSDKVITSGTFGILAIPNFMMAILLILIFAENLGWFPATGWTRLTDDPVENMRRAFLPAMALASAEFAVYTRVLRADMIGTLQQDSITMARAKGLTTGRVLFRHALRPSSFSLMTVVGVQLGAVLSGSIIVETLFGLPGIGRELIMAIQSRDLIMVQGIALVIATAFVVMNFVVDLLYNLLDPRIRNGAAANA